MAKGKIEPPVQLSAKPDKEDNLEYDLGNLAAFDNQQLDVKRMAQNANEYIHESGRDNVQFLFNHIFDCDSEQAESGRLATLPRPLYALPREKPLPKPKVETRWEEFAKSKGIQKRKRSRMVYDEVHDKDMPRYGYKRANDESTQWLLPAKHGEEMSTEDPWAKHKRQKLERVQKNKKHQQVNLQKASGIRVPGTIDLTTAANTNVGKGKGLKKDGKGSGKKAPHHVDVALQFAQHSTSSMGKFDQKRFTEPDMKVKRTKTAQVDLKSEKSAQLASMNAVLGKSGLGKGDKDNAINIGKKQVVNFTDDERTPKGKKSFQKNGRDKGKPKQWNGQLKKPMGAPKDANRKNKR